MFRRAFGIVLVVLLWAKAPSQTPLVPDVPVPQEIRARLIERMIRIEPTRRAAPGVCLTIGPKDLIVRLRGERVPTERLEVLREPEPMLHVLLVDTSGSMMGKLDFVREAAESYVARLRPGLDRAMLMTFDESVVLVQGPTDDRDRLVEAIRSFRMGWSTAMLDGLHEAIRELRGHRERPVILLLTDGVDTASVHERGDVLRVAKGPRNLTIFTIGLSLPPVGGQGPTGMSSTRKFLQLLASGTHGAFFDSPTASRLPRIYGRIRELLESEATLTVADPDPYVNPGRLVVKSRSSACKVRVYEEPDRERSRESWQEPIEIPETGLPQRMPFETDPAYLRLYSGDREQFRKPVCLSARNEPGWFVESEPGRIRGCGLDVTLELGLLYSPFDAFRATDNGWLELRNRAFDVPVPALSDLPRAPEDLLDGLAAHALAVADRNVEIHPLKKPARLHARPFLDYPSLDNGMAFFDLRPWLGWALYAQPEYREWTRARLRGQAGADLARLRERMARLVGDVNETTVDAIVRETERGRRILERAESPSAADVMDHLAAWLGDIPAHDLFVRWEASRIDRLLAAGTPVEATDRFLDEWTALRRIFFVPSYARILTLLSPVHDPVTDRIGYYRVVLPRPGWMLARVKGYKHHPEHTDLPLDLVPDLPMGYQAVRDLIRENPGLAGRTRGLGLRATAVSYELLGKPRTRDPRRAFNRCRVTVTLAAEDGLASFVLVAEATEDRLERVEVISDGDPVLEKLTLPAYGS